MIVYSESPFKKNLPCTRTQSPIHPPSVVDWMFGVGSVARWVGTLLGMLDGYLMYRWFVCRLQGGFEALRELCAAHMLQHRDEFLPFLDLDAHAAAPDPFIAYCDRVRVS